MSYMKHKVNLPQDLEDLADGDGATAIYVGDTKIIPANIGGLGQRVRKPGIPYWLDLALKLHLKTWSDTHSSSEYLTATGTLPTNWTNYEALVSGTAGDKDTATYSSNIGTIFTYTGMHPWGMGTLNDGWGYVDDWQDRPTVRLSTGAEPWATLARDGENPASTMTYHTTFQCCKGGGWWESGNVYYDVFKKQEYSRRVLYRLAAFKAGICMDHPQTLWTKVLTDSEIRLLVQALNDMLGADGRLSNYKYFVDDAALGTLRMEYNAGLAWTAEFSDLVTDTSLQPLGEPRTIWDYDYISQNTFKFELQKRFYQKALDDSPSLELSDTYNTTHQVIWLTPEIPFSRTGKIKVFWTASSTGVNTGPGGVLTGVSGQGVRGYVEARWVKMRTVGNAYADNHNAVSDFANNPAMWEDTFYLGAEQTVGDAPIWTRLIVNYRSRSVDPTLELVAGDTNAFTDNDGDLKMEYRPIAIGIIVPNDFVTQYDPMLSMSIEVELDRLRDGPWQGVDSARSINGVW